jgi:DNA-binding NarL/FixJ family response regulator
VPLRDAITSLAARAHIRLVDRPVADRAADGVRVDLPVSLTAQETRVLRLVAAGMSNLQIATELFISPKTVSVHVSNVLRKLDVRSRVEAAAWADQVGLGGRDRSDV